MLLFQVSNKLSRCCFPIASGSLNCMQQKRLAIPCTSQQIRNLSIVGIVSEIRNFSEGFSGTIFSKNLIEFFMENCETSFTSSLIASGLIIRLAMLPFYYIVEKNQAKKLHSQNIIAVRVTEKIAKHYGLPMTMKSIGDVVVCNIYTKMNEKIIREQQKMVTIQAYIHNRKNGLLIRHTYYTLFIPAIAYMSLFFAARDILYGATPLTLGGWMWIPNLLQPDPFYITPFFVTTLFIVNHLLRIRFVKMDNLGVEMPVSSLRLMQCGFGFFYIILFATISNNPGAFQLYMLTIGLHGLLQNLLLRTPAIKQKLNIMRLPSDKKFVDWKDYFLFWKVKSNLPINNPKL